MSTPFRLYDSLRRQKLAFEPLVPGKIGMYVCGPTTYAAAHIGHAFSAIAFDTVRRALEFLGWDVSYVRNVTDVDDKIIKSANELGEDALALSARFAADYNRDMALFGVRAPSIEPRVSTHIEPIIALIEQLVATGYAYPAAGDVYYEVAKFPLYGQLSGQTPDELQAGARIDVAEQKRAPADFALWKGAKPGEPAWDSPWGRGRPAWHIECSAMTLKHLGATFDIHGGGLDLKFPHHENEIAQSQGAHGPSTFARYWMHNGLINREGVKMSKSLGNVLDCSQIAEAVGGEALRYFCVSHHYRSAVDFDFQIVDGVARFYSLEEADRSLAYFYETLRKLDQFVAKNEDGGDGAVVEGADALVAATREALADDFNTPIVVAAMHEAAKLANKLEKSGKGIDKAARQRSIARLARELRAIGAAIGLLETAPTTYLAARRDRLVRVRNIDVATVQAKVAARADARAAKDWDRGDAIRRELEALGVSVLDGDGGTDWTVTD